jgi:hypothetical protein
VYAFALLGYDPVFRDDSTLLKNVAEESVECINGFNVQESHPLFWKAVPAIITTWRLGSY